MHALTCRPRIAWAFALAVAFGCGSSGETGPTSIEEALAAAMPGDVVEMGAGAHLGSLEVPAGVTLRGACAGTTTLTIDSSDPVVVLHDGATLECVQVIPRGGFGVAATDAGGSVVLRQVQVNFGEGLGIGLQDLARAELVDVAVLGTVRVDNVSAFTEAVSPTNSPVAGLLAFDVAELVLDDVGIRGPATPARSSCARGPPGPAVA